MRAYVIFLVVLLIGIQYDGVLAQKLTDKSRVRFHETISDFPRLEKNLRKWDAPVVADLDQDGFPDLLLNEHGLGISVCWNNAGKLAKPYDIIMGDLHGISVGDYNLDGLLEVVMSRGGGSGANARNSKLFRVTRDREFIDLPDFDEPLALMRGRTVIFFDGDNDGDLDLLNFAFPDKEMKGVSENYIYKNDGNAQLVHFSNLPAIKVDGQKTLLTDYNNDGIFDIFLYGDEKVQAYKGNGDLSFTDVSDQIFETPIRDVEGMVELDYDNDGDFDIYLTRGRDFEIGETFFDSETHTWGFFTKRGAFQFEDLEVGDILNVENFQCQWPDNDAFYIGETGYLYEFSGETHSGKNFRFVNSDALGYPDKLQARGTHVGYIGNRRWRLAGNLWAPATGVVHGVKDYPSYDHPDGLTDVLLENVNGEFKDVTRNAGLQLEEHTNGVAAADLNNDGFQDLIVIRRGNLIHENRTILYQNNREKGFERISEHNVISKELGAIGMAIETFDYNIDGSIDLIVGNERGKWHLFKNTTDNKYGHVIVRIGNSPEKNISPLGAKVSIEICGVKQVKRVGSTGASYSLGHNTDIHFGLGECTENVKLVVVWPNGEEYEANELQINRIIEIGNYKNHN